MNGRTGTTVGAGGGHGATGAGPRPAAPRDRSDPADPLTAALARLAPQAGAVTVAVVRGGRQTVHCHGRSAPDGPAVTPRTVFELGSVTKTFTALLLAELVAAGAVRYDDPLDAHLPPGRRPTVRRGGPITLLHLATHTSGLPRLPPGLLAGAVPHWYTNPYAAFQDDQLVAALARTTVRHPPGSRLRYSNYGVALLGRVLAGVAGTDYPTLLADRISRPLGLHATTCESAPPHRAVGLRHGRPLPPWRIPALPGAGALRSDGEDVLRYLRALLAPEGLPLATALADVLRPRLRMPTGDELCLVWNLRRLPQGDLLFHTGATRGFTAFLGLCPQRGTALAALANCGPALDGRFVQGAYTALKALEPDT